jgi:error-prone DNA polymerase
MVHPYLRRRQGKEDVSYPSPAPAHGPEDELELVLGKTLGVPLFQEQAMRIAIEAAKFTPEEANALRRAMATFRNIGTIHKFLDKMVDGMVSRGYERTFAEACFKQIEGFGTYGFPESHAASFALLVYVSAWLKCHHPAAFAVALLNSQPMGFYAPAQILRDAREHGVVVRGVDVNASQWDSHIEDGTIRLGFCVIDGFRTSWAEEIIAARGAGFADFHALTSAGIPRPALEHLAEADALQTIIDRRIGLWRIAGLDKVLPPALLADARRVHKTPELPLMSAGEQVIADYRTTGFSLRAHPCALLRERLAGSKILTCAQAIKSKNNFLLRTAGIVTVRQRPGTAKGTVFITIEDETGIANIIIWPSLVETYRTQIINASLLIVEGVMQRSEEGVVHIVARQLADRSRWIAGLDAPMAPNFCAPMAHGDELPRPGRAPTHPRQERVVRKSRDFH